MDVPAVRCLEIKILVTSDAFSLTSEGEHAKEWGGIMTSYYLYTQQGIEWNNRDMHNKMDSGKWKENNGNNKN